MKWTKISELTPSDNDICVVFDGTSIFRATCHNKNDEVTFELDNGTYVDVSKIYLWFKVEPPKFIEKTCRRCGHTR